MFACIDENAKSRKGTKTFTAISIIISMIKRCNLYFNGILIPRIGKAFFNSLSSLMCGALYVTAASDKQRGWICPTHKNPSKLENGFRGQLEFYLGVTKPPTKAPFFLFGGLMPFY